MNNQIQTNLTSTLSPHSNISIPMVKFSNNKMDISPTFYAPS